MLLRILRACHSPEVARCCLARARRSFVGVLAAQPPVTMANLFSFPQPAADVEILRKHVSTDNGIDLMIDDLPFEVPYAFNPTNDNLRARNVRVSDDIKAVILVSRQDINSRQRGPGSFNRVFPTSGVVRNERKRPCGFDSPRQIGRRCGPSKHICSPRRRAQLLATHRPREWDASAIGLGELRLSGINHIWCVAVFECGGDSIRDENNEEFEPLTGEMIPYAKTLTNAFRLKPDIANTEPENGPSLSHRLLDNTSSTSAPRAAEALLIYAVDDAPELTELYTILLEATGYNVRTFNDRAKALTALKAERIEPNLLITDCVGTSMCVDRFMECCLLIHPNLRILMASGYSRTDVRFSRTRPDWFIQKPFTAEEFLKRVRVALVA